MSLPNKQIVLKKYSTGCIEPSMFELVSAQSKSPNEGEILIQNVYLSVDPYMGGRMSTGKSYADTFLLEQVIEGGGVGRVIESRDPKFNTGDFVFGLLRWEEYTTGAAKAFRKVDAEAVPLPYYLSVLGMPGATAYAGLMDVANLKAGETVFISAASGAVGSVAGQIAKIMGCKVVGCAGTDEKVSHILNELGFDAAFNYNKVDDFTQVIGNLCPEGIDVLFENVGGELMPAALNNMNTFGRIALCGLISQYDPEAVQGLPNTIELIIRRVTIRGFLVGDHRQSSREFYQKAPAWIQEGKLTCSHSIAQGIEAAPEALMGLFTGDNFGKQLVKVCNDQNI